VLVGFALLITSTFVSGNEVIGPLLPPLDPLPETAAVRVPFSDDGDFWTAARGGAFWLKLRYRFEEVDQAGIAKRAHASTLRTVLGYETASWKGFTGLIELEDIREIGDDAYNNTLNGVMRPVVVDPEGGELNRAQINYELNEHGTVMAGRQRIKLDNDRFIGNVGWRQNEQTFDALAVEQAWEDGPRLFLAYVDNVNRIFGEASPAGNAPMQSILFNVGMQVTEWLDAVAYFYELDYNGANTLSTSTVGLRLTGSQAIGDENELLYAVEYADQSDTGDNPATVDVGYSLIELGAKLSDITVKVGNEVLEGSATGPSFMTPLATLHAHNGWADKFLMTPPGGLNDTFVSVGGTAGDVGLRLVYHMFEADTAGGDYGDEIDLLATYPLDNGQAVGLKFADYSADGFATDTQKIWFWWTVGV